MEPKTENLLLGQFTEEQCRALFPKKPSKKYRAVVREILKVAGSSGSYSAAELTPAFTELQALSTATQRDSKNKGLRIDVQLVDPIVAEEIWVDVAAFHPMTPGRLKAEHKQLRENFAQPLRRRRAGKAVEDHQKLKHMTYMPMLSVARKQWKDGKRICMPQFLGSICSTLGEFSPDMVRLQEWLVKAHLRKLGREGDRADGRSMEALSAQFRNELRNAVIVAVMKGQAEMLVSAGLPSSSCRKYLTETSNGSLLSSRSSCSIETQKLATKIDDEDLSE